MSDRTQLPSNEETSPSLAQLFIAVSPPLDFKPKIDFQVPSRWMFAALNPITTTWVTAQGRQNEARYALVKYDGPPAHSKFFEIASILVSELCNVEARVSSVLPEENPQGEAEFNRQYVRDVEDQARDALLAAETFAKLQLKAS
ncbi:hypothetical protein Forpe1208_v013729 [Fusarium oxysporum f. sp. rapae]|uniref:Uncharacterized protein n=1 Tax=Fusarium oxysporum f. sp. rapae TaxID=485398 RepID=A0A8J5TR23_FUSOX|nr:hypothetical protein Forpe1208_v013729 [Fusarium oxysporum f. sp. rapae]